MTQLRVVVADDNPVVRAGLTALLSGRDDISVVAEAANGHEACEVTARHRPDVVLLDVRMPVMDGLAALPYLASIAPVMMLTYSGESETVQEALRRGAGGYLVHGEFTVEQLIAAVRDIGAGRAHLTPTAAGALVAHLRATGAAKGATEAMSSDADADANAHSDSEVPYDQRPVTSPKPSQLQSNMGQSRFQLSGREAEIMDLIASGMNNQQIAATCFISEKTVKNHINRIFAKLHSTNRAEAAAKWLGAAG
ncbi:response regulator [Streptomyces sp. NEAU-NA10]|uniref:response regulator n=1 Tax=Streptomyces sp. NEAU-NA10 TaxID=3416050 RepID=UPI003CC59111